MVRGRLRQGPLRVCRRHGIVVHLVANRTGLMVSLGADAVAITMGR